MRTAYRCRMYPTEDQKLILNRTLGCVRKVWNLTLAERHRRWFLDKTPMSYVKTNEFLTAIKHSEDCAFLNEVSSVPLQQALRHQHQAFQNFFAKAAKYPRFKNYAGKASASYSRAGFSFRNGQLTLAKMKEPISFIWSWPEIDVAQINPTTVTISRDPSSRWFVSFSCEVDDPKSLQRAKKSVGIDLGLKDFAVLSTGECIVNPRYMDKHEQRLKRYQRILSRRKKGSNNRNKARIKVARQHAKVADARRDFLHKTSTRIVQENDIIAIEDLAICNMVKNRKLSKAISRVGWGEFRRQLEYKAERAGRELVVVDRFYPSSKTCSDCGYLLSELSLKTRTWVCPGCGTLHDRDLNAAKNILAAGLAVSACGPGVRPRISGQSGLKQENLKLLR